MPRGPDDAGPAGGGGCRAHRDRRERVRHALGRWEQAIADAIAAGELPASIVPADLARTLAAVIQGGYVLARAKGEQAPMDAAIRGAVSLLDAAHAAVNATDQPDKETP